MSGPQFREIAASYSPQREEYCHVFLAGAAPAVKCSRAFGSPNCRSLPELCVSNSLTGLDPQPRLGEKHPESGRAR